MKKLRKTGDKRNIGVIFGGISNEHEISCVSVVSIAESIDRDEWNIYLIGITKEGSWLLAGGTEDIKTGSWYSSRMTISLSLRGDRKIFVTDEEGTKDIVLDVCFPVLHGAGGEDGTIQGLFEMAGIPYVGCGVESSAVCMDKLCTKIIAADAGIRQAAYVGIARSDMSSPDWTDKAVSRIEAKLGYPVFIKPSRSGSSVGVSRADTRAELAEGLRKAAETDSRILAEEFIEGREIETAVLGGGSSKALVSGAGEILAAAEFYDYDAKYNNPDSRTVLDPDLPEETIRTLRETALRVYQAVDGHSLARVDFFVTPEGGVVFNEINTMPGFTSISMYPMLWEKRGISRRELVSRLIESAFERKR